MNNNTRWETRIQPKSEEHLDAELHHSDGDRRYDAITDSGITLDHIYTALRDPEPAIRAEAASHPNGNEDTIRNAQYDTEPLVRDAAIRKNPNASASNITAALDDPESSIRELAVSHPNASTVHLVTGLADPDRDVRLAALRHPNAQSLLSQEHLTSMFGDDEPDIRARAAFLHHRKQFPHLKDKDYENLREEKNNSLDIVNAIVENSDDLKNIFLTAFKAKVQEALDKRKQELASEIVSEEKDDKDSVRTSADGMKYTYTKVKYNKDAVDKSIKKSGVKGREGKMIHALLKGRHENVSENKRNMPLEGHPYHDKSDDQLRYIIKDAGEAAKAMRTHKTISGDAAESKYLDQINDASTVLNYRKRNKK